VNDLLKRLDRPIVEAIANRNADPKPAGPEDDLAAGITYWTLQWQSSERGQRGWDGFHKQAEFYLSKASHEGDEVQQSFASLAYAFCALRGIGDWEAYEKGTGEPMSPESIARLDASNKRLKDTYERFRNTVPERALRAAFQLEFNYYLEKLYPEKSEWHNRIRSQFPKFSKWNSYTLFK